PRTLRNASPSRPAAARMSARCCRGHRVSCYGLVNRKRERAAHCYAGVKTAVLESFRQQERTSLHGRRRDDQAVPPAQSMPLLDLTPTLHDRSIDHLRVPSEERAYVVPGLGKWDAG